MAPDVDLHPTSNALGAATQAAMIWRQVPSTSRNKRPSVGICCMMSWSLWMQWGADWLYTIVTCCAEENVDVAEQTDLW